MISFWKKNKTEISRVEKSEPKYKFNVSNRILAEDVKVNSIITEDWIIENTLTKIYDILASKRASTKPSTCIVWSMEHENRHIIVLSVVHDLMLSNYKVYFEIRQGISTEGINEFIQLRAIPPEGGVLQHYSHYLNEGNPNCKLIISW